MNVISDFFPKKAWKWFFLTCFSCLIFFSGAFNNGIPKDQEGRAALIAKTMLDTHNWLDIYVKNEVISEKPILSYWFCTASSYVFGLNEFALRLPTILAGIFTALLTCYLYGRIYGSGGFLAGYIISTMMFFVYVSHEVSIDAVLSLFYLITMIMLYIGYFENYRATKKIYLFYIFLSISVMIKGPLTILLVGLTGVFLILKKWNFRIIWELKVIRGIIIVLLLSAPWFIYESLHAKFAYDFFINQNISRFTGLDMSYKDGHRGPWLFYFVNLFGSTLPWSIFVPFALVQGRKKLFKLSDKTWFLIFWVVGVFIFFTLAAIKRGDYILPLYPALAILIARYVYYLIQRKYVFNFLKIWELCCALIFIIGVVAGILVRYGVLRRIGELASNDKLRFVSEWDGYNMIGISDWINDHFIMTYLAVLIIVFFIFIMGKFLEKGKIMHMCSSLVVVLFIGILFYFCLLVPDMYKYESVKTFCMEAQRSIPKNAFVTYSGDWNTELAFFMNRKYNIGTSYNTSTGLFDDKYIIDTPDDYEAMPKTEKSKLDVVLSTIENHRNPHLLLIVKHQYLSKGRLYNQAL